MAAVAKPRVENHCPFGCVPAQLDENGHCYHLIGFTNDGKTYEPNRPMVHPLTGKPNGLRHTVGNNPTNDDVTKRVNLRKIRSDDTLVNPEFQQLDNGAYHTAKKWVSSRVYREMPKLAQPGLSGSDYLDDDEPVETTLTVLADGTPAKASAEPPEWAAGLVSSVTKLNERLDAIEAVMTAPKITDEPTKEG